jgi:hypothetical protein
MTAGRPELSGVEIVLCAFAGSARAMRTNPSSKDRHESHGGDCTKRQSDLRQRAQAERALAGSGSKPARRNWRTFAAGRCRGQPPSIFVQRAELGKLESKLAAIRQDERPAQRSLGGQVRLTPCNIVSERAQSSLGRCGSRRVRYFAFLDSRLPPKRNDSRQKSRQQPSSR